MINGMLVKAVLAGGVMAAWFQTPMAPPMKMGLWETTTSMTMAMPGMQMPPGRTSKVRSCVTPDSWSKAFGRTRDSSSCTMSNESRTATHFSFDMTCPNAKAHADMEFVDSTTGHGTVHMDANAGGKAMTMDTTWDAKYVGADCGSVTPSKPQTIQ